MKDYTQATYGDRIADNYDRMVTGAVPVEALERLAAGGRALELGIGTGRVALPLAARGVEVHGIESSEAMVAKLRDKPGGDAIPVTVGDFADFRVDGMFELIFVVFNTFFMLTSQEQQVQCYARVAEHLGEGGVFLIEAFVPDPTRFTNGQSVGISHLESDAVQLDLSRHDAAGQRVTCQHLVIDAAGTRLFPAQLRYAWPSELDLMARLAGLRLRERWGGWSGSRFTSSSTSHVSLYEHAPAGSA